MPLREFVVDLCGKPASRVCTAAFYALKELKRGETVILLTPEEPSLMMQSLDLQLHHNLSWTIAALEAGNWRVEVHHRGDRAPADIIDLLMRDHKRLDTLLGQALRLMNSGNAHGAEPLIHEFAAGLRRHVHAENEVLAPHLHLPTYRHGADPLSIMLREHLEILAQLELIESCLAGGEPEAGELGALLAILSGTMAKHEHREEANLFPHWNAMLNREPERERKELLEKLQATLGMKG